MANLSSPWSVNLKTKGYPPEHWLQHCAPSKPAQSAPAPSYRKDAADSDRLWNDHWFWLVMLLFADEHFSVSLDWGTQHSLHSQFQPLATGKVQWTLWNIHLLLLDCSLHIGVLAVMESLSSTHSSTLPSPQHTLQHCPALNTLFNTVQPSTHSSTLSSPQHTLQHCPALNTLFNTARPSTHSSTLPGPQHTLQHCLALNTLFNTAWPSTHSSTLPGPQHTLQHCLALNTLFNTANPTTFPSARGSCRGQGWWEKCVAVAKTWRSQWIASGWTALRLVSKTKKIWTQKKSLHQSQKGAEGARWTKEMNKKQQREQKTSKYMTTLTAVW